MKKSIVDRIFPVKYDFYEMLAEQAKMNLLGIETLFKWLGSEAASDRDVLINCVKKADGIRLDMEKKLTDAFSTPFDRGDIYSISVAMDRVIEYAQSTMLSMEAFEVAPDDCIINMVARLRDGTDGFAGCISNLKSNPTEAGQNILKIRQTHIEIEQLYRDGMAVVFKSDQPMLALKHKEVYHHIKDASSNLEDAVDILHRIVVRLT